jgi:glycosyltransferase involved in cell wall biosynthesis
VSPPERVALVHDFLVDVRGAERVFLELCRIWPQADVFTAIYDERGTEGRFADRRVHTSFLQHLHPTARTFRGLLPLYPRAIEALDLSGYDLVISSSSAWAHGVRTPPGAVHVSYCHNPFRYAWSERRATLDGRGPLTRPALGGILSAWRHWDRRAALRVDRYVANARITRERIGEYFGRSAEVVHPPVEVRRFVPAPVGRHYVCLSELIAHKQLHVAIEAFNRLGRQLVIVGDGPDYRHLRRLAGPTVGFAGRLSDEVVSELLPSCRALVVTSVEEFGIAAVEAQAGGRPVIGRASGGTLETVIDGVTGRLWSGGVEDLVTAVERFDDGAVEPAACVQSAMRFSPERFENGIRAQVGHAIAAAASGADGAERPTVVATAVPTR